MLSRLLAWGSFYPFLSAVSSVHVMPTYSSILRQLYRINALNPVKLDLSNSQKLDALLGSPLSGIPIVHIGGTNGKGSVCLKTAKSLMQLKKDAKIGLFVSPHISSFRERIQVNGVPISEEDVQTMLPNLFNICDRHNIPATFFELTTALAFLKFKTAHCDAVVLEVGLGGRLDSTNIVQPSLSVITSVQLDHTKILGNTVEEIAIEKSGIFKRGIDALVGPGCPGDVLLTRAKEVGAPLYTLDDVLLPEERLYNKMSSDIDDLNSDIARAVIRRLLSREENKKFPIFKDAIGSEDVLSHSSESATSKSITRALTVRPPCRFEVFQVKLESNAEKNNSHGIKNSNNNGNSMSATSRPISVVDVVLDIAHNYDAIVALVRKLKTRYAGVPMRMVLGMSADKDVKSCVAVVLGLLDPQLIHCVEARHPRAMTQTALRALIVDVARTTQPLPQYIRTGAINSNNEHAAEAEANLSIREAVRLAIKQLSYTSSHPSPANSEEDKSFEVHIVRSCNSSGAGRNWESAGSDIGKRCDGVVVICGSAFIMAEARAAISIIEPRDGDILLEGTSDGSTGQSGVQVLSDTQECFPETTK